MEAIPDYRGDRHRAGSVQLKLWLSEELKYDFNSLCARQGVSSSAVVRGLIEAYLRQATGGRHGDATQG